MENLALRHQLMVLNRRVEQSHFHRADRLLWVALRAVWSRWTGALVIVQAQTVVRWTTFLRNHATQIVAVDFFTVPTVTFRVLFVFLILAHDRRRIRHFAITEAPSAGWTAQQVVEAFAFEPASKYLVRDRDGIYGAAFIDRVAGLGTKEKLIAPRSPWQSPYVERLIGSIRRECLDHFIILNGRHLEAVLAEYLAYYHEARTHLALGRDCPVPRPVEPAEPGEVVAMSMVGDPQHRSTRRAA